MRKVHEKSIVLGIGIGMIITAIAGMIFSAGNQKELSKAEIISLAKGYGLIEQVKFLNGDSASINSTNVEADNITAGSSTSDNIAVNSSTNTTTAETTKAVDGSANAADKQQQSDRSSSSTAKRNISIKIKQGFNSEDIINTLLEKGVITNKEDFAAMMDSYKASKKIRVGTFMFKKNDDLDYIVKTICKFK